MLRIRYCRDSIVYLSCMRRWFATDKAPADFKIAQKTYRAMYALDPVKGTPNKVCACLLLNLCCDSLWTTLILKFVVEKVAMGVSVLMVGTILQRMFPQLVNVFSSFAW